MIEKAREWTFARHMEVNHFYDGKPYSYHLQMVVDVAYEFIHLIPEEKRETVIAGCYSHDVIEDARQTYNDVKNALGEGVAELSYALTNEKGKIRSERANDKYYQGIRETLYATFIKLCDRIANIRHSKKVGSKMFEMYKKETPKFISKIYDSKYKEMFEYLEALVSE